MLMLSDKIKNFPTSPGVYLMSSSAGEVLYVGKATSLRERVRSYFGTGLSTKTIRQMEQVADIEYIETDSELEALILESKLIRKFNPKYNIDQKDDKSRIYVNITKENFPRIELVRETDLGKLGKSPLLYGPFQSTKSLRDALELIRKIIPYRSCKKMPARHCIYGSIGLCDKPCEKQVSQVEYGKSIRRIRDFFEGKKSRVLSGLRRELSVAAKKLDFERAAKLRDQVYALEHLKQMFSISKDNPVTVFHRIEGYDISNIFGEFATGSMVVFQDGVSEKSEYRKFRVNGVRGANDIAMLGEVLRRRFQNDWDLPDLILVDGGRGQVNAAVEVISANNLDIPVIGLAKGPDRKKDELVTSRVLPRQDIVLFKQVRDEAHRFARNYYQKLHRKSFEHR